MSLTCVLQEILECKMNLKRRIVLKQTIRLTDSNSNSPPVLVTFEDQVETQGSQTFQKTCHADESLFMRLVRLQSHLSVNSSGC